jgi:hypothetical protein
MVPQSNHVIQDAHNLYVRLRESDVAWAAGFIDGEGCLHGRTYKQRGAAGLSYQMTLSVNNVDPAPLRKLQSLFGGSVNGPCYPKGNRKPVYAWRIGMRKLSAVLPLLLPFPTVKKRQAEIALSLLERMHSARWWLGLTADEHKIRAQSIDELKALNHRGVAYGA